MSYYDVLCVPPSATQEEITSAYRKRARETHPDIPGSERSAFESVVEAHEVLGDPAKRREYDAGRARPAVEDGGPAADFLDIVREAVREHGHDERDLYPHLFGSR